MKINSILATIFLLLIFVSPSLAQTPTAAVPTVGDVAGVRVPQPITVGALTRNGPLDPSEIPWKLIIQIGFVAAIGVLSLFLQYIMFSKIGATPNEIIKGVALVLIITLSVSTLIFGFDDKQVAPIVGLFGTIIGFLLGKVDSKTEDGGAPKPKS